MAYCEFMELGILAVKRHTPCRVKGQMPLMFVISDGPRSSATLLVHQVTGKRVILLGSRFIRSVMVM